MVGLYTYMAEDGRFVYVKDVKIITITAVGRNEAAEQRNKHLQDSVKEEEK